jgi:outer membrane lipoprotein-sorting protein
MWSETRLLPLLLPAALACLGASCGGVPRPRDGVSDATEMMRLLGEIRGRAHSLRARGKADHFGPDGRVRGTVYFFVEADGRLRFEALTPLDTAAATLASDGTTFSLLDARERVYYTGPAEPCNIARLLRIPMAGRDVATILLGGTPLIAHTRARLDWDDDGFYVLVLTGSDAGVRQRVEIAADRRRLDVLRSVVLDGDDVVWELELEDLTRVSGIPFPKKIHFVNPGEDADVLVQYQQIELNPSLPDDAWTIAPPEGMPQRRVTCGD